MQKITTQTLGQATATEKDAFILGRGKNTLSLSAFLNNTVKSNVNYNLNLDYYNNNVKTYLNSHKLQITASNFIPLSTRNNSYLNCIYKNGSYYEIFKSKNFTPHFEFIIKNILSNVKRFYEYANDTSEYN